MGARDGVALVHASVATTTVGDDRLLYVVADLRQSSFLMSMSRKFGAKFGKFEADVDIFERH